MYSANGSIIHFLRTRHKKARFHTTRVYTRPAAIGLDTTTSAYGKVNFYLERARVFRALINLLYRSKKGTSILRVFLTLCWGNAITRPGTVLCHLHRHKLDSSLFVNTIEYFGNDYCRRLVVVMWGGEGERAGTEEQLQQTRQEKKTEKNVSNVLYIDFSLVPCNWMINFIILAPASRIPVYILIYIQFYV